MKEQFVTYEIALKLKELGFDEECLAYFEETLDAHPLIITHYEEDSYLKAPLWQQCIDWFREKYDVIIDVAKIYNGTENYHYAINLIWEYYEGSYYEAREQAILKCIELLKNK